MIYKAYPIFDHAHPKHPHPFSTMSTPMSFNQFLTSMNPHQHAKNQAFTSFCSSDIAHLKILQSDWLRAFWPILLEPDFSQICDLCNNTADNIKFRYRPNSDKINNGFPINSTNPISGPFLVYFTHFGGKRNLALFVTHNTK